MSSRLRQSRFAERTASRRAGRIAPIGGTTLLVLVTLVLATGQRDTLPVRQASVDARWCEPASTRETQDAEARPSAPTKPAAPKFSGVGSSLPRIDVDADFAAATATLIEQSSISSQRLVRVALLNLPPPAARA